MAGRLTIVPTPVGNLGDMTFRGVEALKEADLILAEDTRTSSVLLRHFGISTPMESHHKYNEHSSVERIVGKIEGGARISDPGFLLSRQCRRAGVEVECLPGATAFVPALVASGLPTDRFVFEGFLPPKKGRATRLAELAADERTVVIYESPKRLGRTLRQLAETFGEDREAAVCREISKVHEEIRRDTLGALSEHYGANQAKGEIVIVVDGASRSRRKDTKADSEE